MFWNMHLYKPACADIPTSKLGLPKSSESALKCRRHIAVTKPPPRAVCWPVRPSGAAEWKYLEKFLRVHGISLQETTRAETGMAYRYFLIVTSSNLGTALKLKVLVIKERRIEIAKHTHIEKGKVKWMQWALFLGCLLFQALNCLFPLCSYISVRDSQAHLTCGSS